MNAKRVLKSTPGYAVKTVIVLAFLFPFYWMITTALKTYAETIKTPPTLWPHSVIWDNFLQAWNSGPFALYAKNSIIVTLSIIVIQYLIMVPAAYGFAKFNFRGKNLLFGIVLLAFMTPKQIVFIPVFLMMAQWHLLDTLLPQILPFAANAFGIFLLRQYFMQVPEEIIEAARLDNAGEFKIMWRIMVPMAKSAMLTVALFSFISHWNEYFWPLVMTNTTAVRPLTLGVAMLKDAEGVVNWHIVMAGNTILVVPIIVIYIFASRRIVKAFVYSGIK